jgi:predicted anti-sigma-YlaC factor YlaD
MRCDELYRLLNTYRLEEDRDIASNLIATHIHTCPTCARGLTRLAKSLIAIHDLDCEECRARFPRYYEATHPEYPLALMPASEMAAVALHLGHCTACREQYLALEQISIIEENELD